MALRVPKADIHLTTGVGPGRIAAHPVELTDVAPPEAQEGLAPCGRTAAQRARFARPGGPFGQAEMPGQGG